MVVSRSVQAVHLSTGVDVHYVDQGDRSGVPVLLLHAWGESLGCFDRLISLLPTTLRILAVDQRGHGESDKPAAAYSLPDFAGDVTAFLEAIGLDAAVLVGSFSGGMSRSRWRSPARRGYAAPSSSVHHSRFFNNQPT